MKIEELIAKHSDDSLAKVENGHVWQVWEDGEVTLQKCGSLLGMRNLHTIKMGCPKASLSPSLFPHKTKNSHGEHGFIYTTEEGANEIWDFVWKMAE